MENQMADRKDKGLKPDYRVILDLVPEKATVLDLGCGDGELLDLLTREKHIDGRGIEIDEQAIYNCVERGLSVFHGDIDNGIIDYNDKSFNVVIVNQSLQQVTHLEAVLKSALRVGEKVIVGIPNFADINSRFQIFFRGRAPVTPALPYEWYSTPNLHFCSLTDFIGYCGKHNISINKSIYLANNRRVKICPNLFAGMGIFVIEEKRQLIL
jgi:methionine biosynthesis protein MetW